MFSVPRLKLFLQRDLHVFTRCGQVCKSWNEVIQQDECAYLKRRTHLSEVDAGLEVRFPLLAQHASVPEEDCDSVGVFSVRRGSPCARGRDQAHAPQEVSPQDGSGLVSKLQLLHPPVSQKHFNTFATLRQQQTG